MNKNMCAMLFSCLFFNATLLSMMPDEEAGYIKQREERVGLSCKQKALAMLPCGVLLALGAASVGLFAEVINDPSGGDIITMSIIPITALIVGPIASCVTVRDMKSQNREAREASRIRAFERDSTARAAANNAAWIAREAEMAAERTAIAKEKRENPHAEIAGNIESLQNDLSEKETLTFGQADELQKRWQMVQEHFLANEALYQDDQIKTEHEAMLAEIDATIKEKVVMGLQTHVKSSMHNG